MVAITSGKDGQCILITIIRPTQLMATTPGRAYPSLSIQQPSKGSRYSLFN